MKFSRIIIISFVMLAACRNATDTRMIKNSPGKSENFIGEILVNEAADSLLLKYGTAEKFRINKGIGQVARFWQKEDGDPESFKDYCIQNFIPSGDDFERYFIKTERNDEILTGNFTRMALQLREPLDLNEGKITPIDMMMAGYDPSSHLTDDFFRNKVAFYQLLNYPFYSLNEKLESGSGWSRKEWAVARIGDNIVARIPAEILQNYSEKLTLADAYISEYNIYMDKLTDSSMQQYFPHDLKLISHWGLRDELKSHYGEKNGLTKQKLIYEVMNRIISQEIPVQVINSDNFLWNPFKNRIYEGSNEIKVKPEKNRRYQYLLDIFKASRRLDIYNPYYPTAVSRAFDEEMQMPQDEIERLFIGLLSSGQVRKVAQLISRRLNRPLEPFDIWYNGFNSRGNGVNESVLDKKVEARFPTREAFESSLPSVLTRLGFSREEAQFIASKVTVDPSRGAGHAAGAEMRTDKSHLRTRIGKEGMDYKGFNIAMHEFGHNVEQTLTLYDMDYYSLKGVPNTAFTEALAFIFQKRDLEILGIQRDESFRNQLMALDIFWSCYEIMGVSLVDMHVWNWLYKNPLASPDELKDAVLKIAKDVWNEYYAEIFGRKDQIILAIYSHMISYPLYLSAYPVGYLIDYQIEEYISDKPFASEIKRMFMAGNVTPDLWMKNATGSGISNKALFDAVDKALIQVK